MKRKDNKYLSNVVKISKHLLYIFSLFIFVFFINIFTINAETIEHTHIWTTTYDSTNHWEYCTVCKITKDVMAHTYTDHWISGTESCFSTNYSTRTCTCGYSYVYRKPHTIPNPIVWRQTYAARGVHYYSCTSCGNWIGSGKCSNENGVLSCQNPGTCTTCGLVITENHHYVTNTTCEYCHTKFYTYGNPTLTYANDYLTCTLTYDIYPENGFSLISAPAISYNHSSCKQSYQSSFTTNADGSYTCKYVITFSQLAQRKETVVFGDGAFGKVNGVAIYLRNISPNVTIWQDHTAPIINNITTVDQTSSNGWATIKEFTITGTETFSNIVYLTISDKSSGKVYLNNAAVSVSNGAYQYVCTPPVEASADGRTYVVTAKDIIGNVSTKEITIYKTDGTAPEVESNLSYTNWTNKEKSITLTIIDYGSGTPSASLDNQTSYQPCSQVGEKYQITYTFSDENLSPITHKLYLKDGLGNATVYDLVVGNIDYTKPNINSVSSSPSDTNSTIVINANDVGSGISQYAISVTNSIPTSGWQNSNSLTIPSTGKLFVFVKDVAGNVTSKEIDAYKVTIKDVDKSSNLVLGEKSFYKLNGTSINANILGTNSNDNVYYKKYYYNGSTSATLNGNDIITYRYFSIRLENKTISIYFDDNDNLSNDRPANITISLNNNGVVNIANIETSNNPIKYTFSNLQKYDDNGEEINYTISSNDIRLYSYSINGLSITYKLLDSSFSVIIPKTLIIDGENKMGYYEVLAKGEISNGKVLNVIPTKKFSMKSNGKKDIIVYVTQEKNTFNYNELNSSNFTKTKGTIKANDLSAGSWYGSFVFDISLK